MDSNKEDVIEKIYRLTLQDAEFNAALRKRLKMESSANVVLDNDERLDEIYELCIEKITRKQGEEFYADFPITSLRPTLAYDYNRMERFRRKDDFGDFCLAMYQQIENITNYICSDPIVDKVASKMWACPDLIYTGRGVSPTLENRTGNISIAQFICFGKTDVESIKSDKRLAALSALYKMRSIVYFIGYKAELKYSDLDSFKEICDLLYELYQCRNTNHRHTGLPELYDRSKQTLDKISPIKSFYYSKFHGLLSQYVEYVKMGYPMSNKLTDYADSID